MSNSKAKLAANRRWRARNKERIRAYNQRYVATHPVKKDTRTRHDRKRDPKKTREQSLKWHAANPEKVRESVRKYRAANRDKQRTYNAKRRALKAGNGGSYTDQEWQALCAQYNNRCIGPGPHEGPLCADHVIPVGEPGSTSNISNIQPLCKPCNSRKGKRTIDYRT